MVAFEAVGWLVDDLRIIKTLCPRRANRYNSLRISKI